MQSSPEYDSSNLDLDIIVRELFQPEEWWKNPDLLYESLAHYGTIRGFSPRVSTSYGTITCNREGEKDYARTYSGGGLKTGCPFLFNLKTMHNPMIYPKNYNPDQTGKSKPRRRADYSRETKIISGAPGKKSKPTCYDHGGGCRPSKQNLITSKERSGKYIKAISSSKIFTLCSMAENGKLKPSTIKSVLRPISIWPVNKDITGKKDVFYLWVKVMKLLPVLRANPEYDQFKEAVNDSELLTGIDNELDIDDMIRPINWQSRLGLIYYKKEEMILDPLLRLYNI